jgi:hypothetical protein
MRCDCCGRSVAPRRRDQRFCSAACRGRSHAQTRATAARVALTALDTVRRWIEAEVIRWELAAGSRRRVTRGGAP